LLIAFDSRTGNIKRFVRKLDLDYVDINNLEKDLDNPFLLVTYTDSVGKVPPTTAKFLRTHKHLCVGVAGSGNKNWGCHYNKAVDIISNKLKVPIVHKFELSGTKEDLEIVGSWIKNYEQLLQNT